MSLNHLQDFRSCEKSWEGRVQGLLMLRLLGLLPVTSGGYGDGLSASSAIRVKHPVMDDDLVQRATEIREYRVAEYMN